MLMINDIQHDFHIITYQKNSFNSCSPYPHYLLYTSPIFSKLYATKFQTYHNVGVRYSHQILSSLLSFGFLVSYNKEIFEFRLRGSEKCAKPVIFMVQKMVRKTFFFLWISFIFVKNGVWSENFFVKFLKSLRRNLLLQHKRNLNGREILTIFFIDLFGEIQKVSKRSFRQLAYRMNFQHQKLDFIWMKLFRKLVSASRNIHNELLNWKYIWIYCFFKKTFFCSVVNLVQLNRFEWEYFF